MICIAIVNMKGGVGKTTTAVHLAAGLARGGTRTLLVDADPQGNAGFALGVRGARTIRDLMTGEAGLDEVIVREVRPSLDVIPSAPSAFGLDAQLASVTQRETILARRLRPLTGYGALIVDTSPAMNLLAYNALLVASELIIPVGMDSMAVLGARQTLAGVHEIRELWPERRLELCAVLPTSVNITTNASRAAFAAFDADPELRDRLYRPGIRQCIDLTYAIAQRQTIWDYAPKSRAADDYDAFVAYIAGRRDASDDTQRPGAEAVQAGL